MKQQAPGLTRRDKQLIAAGIRWALGAVDGAPSLTVMNPVAAALLTRSELEARRDQLMPDPEFAEAYEAAGSAQTWYAFAKREGL